MVRVGIVYHSEAGHTEALANSVALGVKETKAQCHVMHWDQPDYETLSKCDAIIFGCPTYMGSVSAELKTFMDKSSDVWKHQKWRNKIAAGFTNSAALSGDKLSTLMQIMLFSMQHGMIWAGLDLMAGTVSSKNTGKELNRVGSWLGLMSQSNIDQDSSLAPPDSDKKTAEYFGKRIAEVAAKFK
jgi:multimeric flavodoxin WrbA